MYLELQQQLIQRVRDLLKQQYDVELPRIVVDQPPNVGLGEYALPLSFELAKKLRKAPRKIAEEIVNGIGEIPGFEAGELDERPAHRPDDVSDRDLAWRPRQHIPAFGSAAAPHNIDPFQNLHDLK